MITDKYYSLAKKKLFPICRSITGDGIRSSLKIIKKKFPDLKITEKKSNTRVFDWKIPPEWNIKDAYVKDKYNKKIINFKKNNLHIVSYSIAVDKFISKKELLKRIHTIPKYPNAIPYVTSYYKKNWGFCSTYSQKKNITNSYKDDDKFKVVIDSCHKK